MERARELERVVEEWGFGKVVGWVTVSEVVRVGRDARIAVEIPPDRYTSGLEVRVGDFLGILTAVHKRRILGRVVGIERAHLAGLLKALPVGGWVDDAGAITSLKLILEPLTECPLDTCEPTNVSSPIDPLSPVFLASPKYIAEMLQLPTSGVLLGRLYAGGRELGVEVRLPPYAVHEHVLVVGTTGSGKTVLLKNMALSLYRDVEAAVLAFDLQGDYLHMTLPPPTGKSLYDPVEELTVIWPITQNFVRDYKHELRNYADEFLAKEGEGDTLETVEGQEEYERAVFYALGKLYAEKSYGVACKSPEVVPYGNEIRIDCGTFSITLIPWALRFHELALEVPDILPVFTMRTAIIYKKLVYALIEECKKDAQKQTARQQAQAGRTSSALNTQQTLKADTDNAWREAPRRIIDCILRKLEEASTKDKNKGRSWEGDKRGWIRIWNTLHHNQQTNIQRALIIAEGSGLFDVAIPHSELIGRESPLEVVLGEPNYEDLFDGFTVVDLTLLRENPTAASIVVYQILNKLFAVRDGEFRAGLDLRPTAVLIDEAHNYFPQVRAGEEMSKEAVEAVINRLARLGRVRKIGLIFATHTPADLNKLVLQLTNTKIGLRSEPYVLEEIGLGEYAAELTYAPDGVGVAKSHVYRTHALVFRSMPPMVFHRSHKT